MQVVCRDNVIIIIKTFFVTSHSCKHSQGNFNKTAYVLTLWKETLQRQTADHRVQLLLYNQKQLMYCSLQSHQTPLTKTFYLTETTGVAVLLFVCVTELF